MEEVGVSVIETNKPKGVTRK